MTVRCAVLGDPIEHSLSPALHRAGYRAVGLDDWEYDAQRVPAGGLARFLEGRDDSWRGLSLTMPLKREVSALVGSGVIDSISARAQLAGAANTLVFGESGSAAENTDIPGAVAAIRERTGAPLRSAVILGGGATATSLGLAVADLGVRTIDVLVRSPERAPETHDILAAHAGRPDVRVTTLTAVETMSADIVVSTIPGSAQTPHLVQACSGVPVLFEAVYDPWPTPLAASAGDRVLVNGLDLLVHQAALQFELFTGHKVPVTVLRTAGQAALAARA